MVAAGTETSSSFSLTPTVSWSPEACVTVYCILSDGEVTMDTAHIPINQHNYVISSRQRVLSYYSDSCRVLPGRVCDTLCARFPQGSLSWSTNKAQPGEQVSLTVTALEPRSQLGIVVMGARGDAPRADLDLKVEQV